MNFAKSFSKASLTAFGRKVGQKLHKGSLVGTRKEKFLLDAHYNLSKRLSPTKIRKALSSAAHNFAASRAPQCILPAL